MWLSVLPFRVLALSAALMMLGASADAANVKPNAASAESARRFVQAFYDWYVDRVVTTLDNHFDKGSSGVFEAIDAVRERPWSFSPNLRRLLNEEAAAKDRCPGFITGLDWDPFLDSQDPSPTYTAGQVRRLANGFRVSLDFYNKDVAPGANPIVEADVAFANGHWMFVDFVQSPTNPKLRQSLVSILKGYERSGEYTAPCPKDDN